ncbi:lipase member J-like isoform X1 [Cylas formicarius]|uniref:lipase member J-like isoform X1 n=1 Tax=Cylas formicarius TaxID=197179 RepID=UPI0029588E63|nr:lipase member J-like isoform X1 [Cylas formicarius]
MYSLLTMRWELKYVVFLIFALAVEVKGSIKVCKKYSDFYISGSKDCWRNNYDVLDVSGIARTWGFKTENYSLILDDGYIITVFRVYNEITQNTPIVLGHGSLTNPLSWVFAGNNSLPYVLGNRGYDVWMVSFRGTAYSKGHVSLSPTDHKYWQFTFHQMGIYDVKSTLDLVHNTTNKKAIYIGYSMGTTNSYVYCSMLPDHCKQRLLGVISYAPVGYLLDAKGVLPILWQPFIWPIVKGLTYTFFGGEFLKVTPAYQFLTKIVSASPLANYGVAFLVGLFEGIHLNTLDPSYIPVVIYRWLDSIGIEVYTHFAQVCVGKNFSQFDYGKLGNIEHYAQEYPPAYPISDISVPVAMFVGRNDYLATLTSSSKFYDTLNSTSQCGYAILEDSKWSHYDFAIAKTLPILHRPTFDRIKDMEQGKCNASLLISEQ